MNSRHSATALSEADADALLSGRALAEHDDLRAIVGLMRSASAVPPPMPTAALAAMLNRGFDPLPKPSAPSGSSWARWSLRIAAVTAAAMTATLGAATANALPAPVQTAVANVVGAVTPLQLPRPAASGENSSNDSGGAGDRPEANERSAEPAEGTSTTPDTDESEPITPPPGTGSTTPSLQQIEEPEADNEPESDQRYPDEPDTDADEPATNQPDSDQPDSDVPDSDVDSEMPDSDGTDADASDTDASNTSQGDAGDYDVPDSDEPDLDVDPESDHDAADAED